MAQIHKCLVFLLVLSPPPIFPVFPFHLRVWEIPWKAPGLRPGPGDPGVLVNSVCSTVHSLLSAVLEAVLVDWAPVSCPHLLIQASGW